MTCPHTIDTTKLIYTVHGLMNPSLSVLHRYIRKMFHNSGHFTVTVGKEAGVDLVLIQPFLLYCVHNNHVVVVC